MQLRFCGKSEAKIAAAIGVTRPTLRRHFAAELLQGHARFTRQLIGILFEQASRGNLAAIKRLERKGRRK